MRPFPVSGYLSAGFAYNTGERPLVPLFVGNADHRRAVQFSRRLFAFAAI
jgi:hypothetical protein